ncbi:MAG: glycosyltransferase family 2 protein [Bacilli bacterium]|nr:glycosyltransferase family 2 protein [Bacilli bacterium]
MNFDIVFVTYNSKKWLDNCIKSIVKSKYDLSRVTLIFYDNNSSDDTVIVLKTMQENYKKKFNDFIVVEGSSNKGFGYGNNQGAKYGKSPYIFFLNVDTEIFPDTLSKLEKEINDASDDVAMFELAQRPYEHPKYYNPVDGDTTWASGACMVVKRKVFEQVNGFDTNIFMYCEDVELSWNFRKHNYKIKYLFDNPIIHYSYEQPNEFKYTQFVYAFVSNYYIRAKYGKFKNYLRGLQYMFNLGFKGKYIPDNLDIATKKKIKRTVRNSLCKNFIKYTWINITKSSSSFVPTFVNNLDYEVVKDGPFYEYKKIKTNPLVSIIVRTCNRKDALRECLISLKNQTYKNIEIVVVEDGKATAKEMIKKEFSDLNIVYKATNEHAGRSRVANIAMGLAKGKYLNFLDDDDLFYNNHVEVLVSELENNNYDIVYDGCFETQINVISKDPYKYEVKAYGLYEARKFSRKKLYNINLFPIQSVMFKRSLFKECGGIDENIDALEDWDFWVRLSLNHDFHMINTTTSIFRTPFDKSIQEDRSKFLASTLSYLDDKFSTYHPNLSVNDFKE